MKFFLLIVMIITIASILIFYKKPKLDKFSYTITFPWRVENKNVLDCSIEIHSQYSELYVNDNISFKVKLFNFNSEVYNISLADRKIIFTMSGLEPTEHIKLFYVAETNSFEGSGLLKFKFSGNYSFQTGYDSEDKTLPTGGLFSSNLSIPILPTLQKYQVILNDKLFLQSKLTLILAVVATVLALLQLLDYKK